MAPADGVEAADVTRPTRRARRGHPRRRAAPGSRSADPDRREVPSGGCACFARARRPVGSGEQHGGAGPLPTWCACTSTRSRPTPAGERGRRLEHHGHEPEFTRALGTRAAPADGVPPARDGQFGSRSARWARNCCSAASGPWPSSSSGGLPFHDTDFDEARCRAGGRARVVELPRAYWPGSRRRRSP